MQWSEKPIELAGVKCTVNENERLRYNIVDCYLVVGGNKVVNKKRTTGLKTWSIK